MKETLAIAEQINSRPADPWALATLVDVAGSSYRRAGARLLIGANGKRVGSVSGGCLEADVVERARRVLATRTAEVITYDTTEENDLVWGVGLGCHGVVRVLIERLGPEPRWARELSANAAQRRDTELAVVWQSTNSLSLGTQLAAELPPEPTSNTAIFRHVVTPPVPLVVCGAGDDAQPLVRLAKELGWHVTIVDPRSAFATTARFPQADAVHTLRPEALAQHVSLDERSLAVVMTHHYVHDLPFLRALLQRPLAYIGLLGPKKRGEKLLADLEAEGMILTPAQRARVHAPVGLDIGGDTPEAVALAILAETQALLHARNARPLRERTRPIHS